MKFLLFQLTLILFISQYTFGQKLLWQSIDKTGTYKFVYCFTLNNETDSVSTDAKRIFDTTIYQINSKEELSPMKIAEIMKCVKNAKNADGRVHSFECSEKKRFYVSMQI